MAYKMRFEFLKTPFDQISEEELLDILSKKFTEEEFRYIVTPNTDHVLRVYQRKDLQEIYNNSWYSVCDSQVILRNGKLKGFPFKHLITGSDLTKKLFNLGQSLGLTFTIIGGDRETIDLLKSKFTSININHFNPPMGFIRIPAEVEKCCEFVSKNPSDYIFLAVGSPQQEILADKIFKRGDCKGVGFCIGASLLFLTNKEKRAPAIISKMGFEWLYRLLQDPKRLWKRYYKNFSIFPLIYKSQRFSEKTHSTE